MRHRLVPLGAAAVLAAGACTSQSDATIDEPERPWVPASAQLVSYDSCDEALDGLRESLEKTLADINRDRPAQDRSFEVGEDSAGAAEDEMSAAPEGAESSQDFSETNVAVDGVDEPDMVKTDGQFVYTAVDGALRVVDADSAEVVTEERFDSQSVDHQLFLGEDELLVLYSTAAGGHDSESVLERRDPRTLEPLDEFTIDGSVLDARMVAGEVRLAVQSSPRLDDVWEEFEDGGSRQDLRAALRDTDVEDWLPSYSVNGAAGGSECDSLAHPDRFAGESMVSVVSMPAGGSWTEAAPTTVMADGGIVHGTKDALYLAHDDRNWVDNPEPGGMEQDGAQSETELYRFVFDGGQARLEGEGVVPGTLLNQYSMSEHKGFLRVATTEESQAWWGVPEDDGGAEDGAADEPSRSTVTVLQLNGDELAEVGSVTDLGVTERIYSVRFIADTAYVVTFRETDPLYTVDLSDPERPTVTGDLKITGYSAYLHPVADGRLLGVGQEATEDGARIGLQASLFDVTGQEATVLDQYVREGADSSAEWDPHGFLHWEQDGIVVLPVLNWESEEAGAVVLEVTDDTVEEEAWLEHDQAADFYNGEVLRSLVIGEQLWTVSAAGLQAVDLDGYEPAEWLAW